MFYCSQVPVISRSPQQTGDYFEDQSERMLVLVLNGI